MFLTYTNLDGKFLIEPEYTGKYKISSIYKGVQYGGGGYSRRASMTCEILESPGVIDLPPGTQKHDIRVVAEQADLQALSLNVQNEEGVPLRFKYRVYLDSGEYKGTKSSVDQLGRLISHLPSEPYSVEITMKGYQARVLVPGRDYTPGCEVRLVLRKGPFLEDNIWEAVTWVPYTEINVSDTPGKEIVKLRMESYRQLAQ